VSSLALVALPARADQFVAMDETWVHTPSLPDSHYRVTPAAGTPSDWTSPVDYSGGTAWVYLEVHTKPTDQPTKFQVCFEATPTYACTNQSPTYTTVGTYEWSTPFADFWSPPGSSVDWSLGVNKLACILKDTMNNKPSADNVGPAEAALYTPTEVRMVVTIVSPGGTYVPPTPTGAGGAGGATSTSASSAASSSTTSDGAGTSTVSSVGSTTGAGGGGAAPSSGGCAASGRSPRGFDLGAAAILALGLVSRARSLSSARSRRAQPARTPRDATSRPPPR
jgi:hypothetical protein